jgi:hypothetical protein
MTAERIQRSEDGATQIFRNALRRSYSEAFSSRSGLIGTIVGIERGLNRFVRGLSSLLVFGKQGPFTTRTIPLC